MPNYGMEGMKFKALREKCGLTQRQLAEYLNVDQSYISKCEKNERQFSIEILEKAASLFGCTLEHFTNDETEYSPAAIALRAKAVTAKDMETIATMNKIALNLRYMEGLLKGEYI
jgi:transcriptional regulator with XRE-family HTH domain